MASNSAALISTLARMIASLIAEPPETKELCVFSSKSCKLDKSVIWPDRLNAESRPGTGVAGTCFVGPACTRLDGCTWHWTASDSHDEAAFLRTHLRTRVGLACSAPRRTSAGAARPALNGVPGTQNTHGARAD